MRTRRKGRWLLRQLRLGARMCQGTFFFKQKNSGLCGLAAARSAVKSAVRKKTERAETD